MSRNPHLTPPVLHPTTCNCSNEFPYWTGAHLRLCSRALLCDEPAQPPHRSLSVHVGYYVSRPEFKAIFHDGGSYFRAAAALHALARDNATWYSGIAALLPLWRAVALTQHHDTITGDGYDNEEEDSAMRVRAGIDSAAVVAGAATAILTGATSATAGAPCYNTTLQPCAALVAALEATESALITLYNPLAWIRNDTMMTLVIPTDGVAVYDGATGAMLTSQTAPCTSPDLPPTTSWWTLVFEASVPPMGTSSYVLRATSRRGGARDPTATVRSNTELPTAGAPVVLSNGLIQATFDDHGALTSIASVRDGGAPITVGLRVMAYHSAGGHENAWSFSSDGASSPSEFPGASSQSVASMAVGPLFSELVVSIDPSQGVQVRYRLYAGEDSIHVFAAAGPFTSATNSSTDAVLRLDAPSIASAGGWLSDSNGAELLHRQR